MRQITEVEEWICLHAQCIKIVLIEQLLGDTPNDTIER